MQHVTRRIVRGHSRDEARRFAHNVAVLEPRHRARDEIHRSLIGALQAGRLGGAVLDVTATEPLPADSPLWALPGVLLTQHTAGSQLLKDEGKVDVFLTSLAHLQAGEPLENLADLSRGY